MAVLSVDHIEETNTLVIVESVCVCEKRLFTYFFLQILYHFYRGGFANKINRKKHGNLNKTGKKASSLTARKKNKADKIFFG
jgi:hypothetical protein